MQITTIGLTLTFSFEFLRMREGGEGECCEEKNKMGSASHHFVLERQVGSRTRNIQNETNIKKGSAILISTSTYIYHLLYDHWTDCAAACDGNISKLLSLPTLAIWDTHPSSTTAYHQHFPLLLPEIRPSHVMRLIRVQRLCRPSKSLCYWASSWAYKCSMYQTKYLTSPQIRNAFDLVENALTSGNKKMLWMRFHLPHTYTARCYLLPSSLLHFFFSWEFSPFHSQIRITKDLLTQTQMNYLHECFPSFWSRSARRRVKWMGQNAMYVMITQWVQWIFAAESISADKCVAVSIRDATLTTVEW